MSNFRGNYFVFGNAQICYRSSPAEVAVAQPPNDGESSPAALDKAKLPVSTQPSPLSVARMRAAACDADAKYDIKTTVRLGKTSTPGERNDVCLFPLKRPTTKHRRDAGFWDRQQLFEKVKRYLRTWEHARARILKNKEQSKIGLLRPRTETRQQLIGVNFGRQLVMQRTRFETELPNKDNHGAYLVRRWNYPCLLTRTGALLYLFINSSTFFKNTSSYADDPRVARPTRSWGLSYRESERNFM